MSIVVNNKPENFDLSKNMMPVSVSSNTDLVINPGTSATLDLGYGGGSADGGFFTLRWQSDSITFYITNSPTPDPSNNKVRPQNIGETNADYVTYLVGELNTNVKLSTYYTIQVSTFDPETLRLFAKETSEEYIINLVSNYLAGFSPSPNTFVPIDQLDTVMSIKLNVSIEDSNQSGTYSLVAPKVQECIDGIALFYIQDLVNPLLKYHIPTFGANSIEYPLHIYKRVKLSLYERFGSPKEDYSLYEYPEYYVLKSGWPKLNFQRINRDNFNTIDAYFGFLTAFFTRRPRTKKVIPGQQEFLFFRFDTSYSSPPVKLNVNAVYENDYSTDTYAFSHSIIANQVVCYPVGLTELSIPLLSGTKKLIYYRIFLTVDGVSISESFKFILDYDNYIDNNIYQFTNSDSGVDTVRFTGMLEETAEFDYDQARRILDYPYDITQGEFFDNKTLKIKKFVQNTGFLTKEECDWLEDLFLAERKFVQGETSFIPIVITTKTKPVKHSQQNLYSFSFEYYVAFEDCVTSIDLSHGVKE